MSHLPWHIPLFVWRARRERVTRVKVVEGFVLIYVSVKLLETWLRYAYFINFDREMLTFRDLL